LWNPTGQKVQPFNKVYLNAAILKIKDFPGTVARFGLKNFIFFWIDWK